MIAKYDDLIGCLDCIVVDMFDIHKLCYSNSIWTH